MTPQIESSINYKSVRKWAAVANAVVESIFFIIFMIILVLIKKTQEGYGDCYSGHSYPIPSFAQKEFTGKEAENIRSNYNITFERNGANITFNIYGTQV